MEEKKKVNWGKVLSVAVAIGTAVVAVLNDKGNSKENN